MTESSRENQLTGAYSRVYEKLCEIFYYVDPEGMGVSIGAPEDEYSHAVSKLLVELKEARDRTGVAKVVRAMYPTAEDVLIDQVFDAWNTFLIETAPSSET